MREGDRRCIRQELDVIRPDPCVMLDRAADHLPLTDHIQELTDEINRASLDQRRLYPCPAGVANALTEHDRHRIASLSNHLLLGNLGLRLLAFFNRCIAAGGSSANFCLGLRLGRLRPCPP